MSSCNKAYTANKAKHLCCRYDHACQDITNIDFSRTVIKEMMLKHLRQRPKMKWLVQDMTATKVHTRSRLGVSS